MKSLTQMDLDDWELLPDEGFLEINDDGSGKKIYSRNYNHQGSASVFQMNYFINAPKSVDKTGQNQFHQRMMPNQILPLQIEDDYDDRQIVRREGEPAAKIPIEIKFMAPSPEASEMAGTFGSGLPSPEPDPISQVFFKKMKETEFADMKMDSPRSSSATNSRFYLFEEDKVDSDMDLDEGSDDGDEEGGLNLWKWGLNGIGAICSFGVAAATVCIIVLSSQHRDRKLQFQIYTTGTDKRMKQAAQHASRLNEAISAVRGVPITRAHITFGGYYDAPL